MTTVNSEIRRILKEKDRALKRGKAAMVDVLKALQKDTLSQLGQAAITEWDSYHLKQMLDSIEEQIAKFSQEATAEAGGLIEETWDMGKTLVDAPLSVAGMYSGFRLSTSVLNTLKDFTFHKIEGLSDAAWEKIRSELTLGVMGGKTPQEVAKAIGMNLTDPSIFTSIAHRAEVITQTEMGRAFSTAAELRMEEAGEHVKDLEKMWRHVGHPKVPRLSHLAADGQHVPVNEPFNVGGIDMMYPRDPGAPIEETINCGCDHVPFHPNWG
jgi:hypothetical protein